MLNLKKRWHKLPEKYRLEAISLVQTFAGAMVAQLAVQVSTNPDVLSLNAFDWAVFYSIMSAIIRAGIKASWTAFVAWNASQK